jgi:hypothetical protein
MPKPSKRPSDPTRRPESSPKADDPEQFRRFIDMVREVGAGEPDPETLDLVLKKVARSPKHLASPDPSRKGKPHRSR